MYEVIRNLLLGWILLSSLHGFPYTVWIYVFTVLFGAVVYLEAI